MISFVSIIRLESGVASYRVVEHMDNDFTAYLVRNASSQSLPEEVRIDARKDPMEGSGADPVVNKLITAIRSGSFLDSDPL
jgi:hypothetical protein